MLVTSTVPTDPRIGLLEERLGGKEIPYSQEHEQILEKELRERAERASTKSRTGD